MLRPVPTAPKPELCNSWRAMKTFLKAESFFSRRNFFLVTSFGYVRIGLPSWYNTANVKWAGSSFGHHVDAWNSANSWEKARRLYIMAVLVMWPTALYVMHAFVRTEANLRKNVPINGAAVIHNKRGRGAIARLQGEKFAWSHGFRKDTDTKIRGPKLHHYQRTITEATGATCFLRPRHYRIYEYKPTKANTQHRYRHSG